MIRQWPLLLALIGFGLQQACADTIELKEKSAIVGKVLAEKPDQVAVDVGYTILVIPRSQVVKILRNSIPVPATKSPAPPKSALGATPGSSVEAQPAFYSAPSNPEPARTVLELVKQIGEAVVQVRTPSGLGSGFFINEDGFLITNFHVIENETQISVEVYHQKERRSSTARPTSRSGLWR